jgi:hypothetical protein
MILKIFHIFVVLIGFIMTTKENTNVPGATAILTLRDETDKPFAEGTSYFTNMKMIQDLGRIYPKTTSKQKRHYAIFECPLCGNYFKTQIPRITTGETTSCGCYRRKCTLERTITHGMTGSYFYKIWLSIKRRCYNHNEVSYEYYGGRGIEMCKEWLKNPLSFIKWAQSSNYMNGLEIDRIDTNKNYSPDNCKWSTRSENMQNTRLLSSRNTSGFRGVSFYQNWYYVNIGYNNKKYRLGKFKTPQQAAQAYNDFVIVHGTAHPLNIIR